MVVVGRETGLAPASPHLGKELVTRVESLPPVTPAEGDDRGKRDNLLQTRPEAKPSPQGSGLEASRSTKAVAPT